MSNPGFYPSSIRAGLQPIRPAMVLNDNRPIPFSVIAQADVATPDTLDIAGDTIQAESQSYDTYSSVSKIIAMLQQPIGVLDLPAVIPQVYLGSHIYSEAIIQTSVGKTALQGELILKCTPIIDTFTTAEMTWNGSGDLVLGDPTELTKSYFGGSLGAAAVHDNVKWSHGEDDPDKWFPFGVRLTEKGYTLHGVVIEVKPYSYLAQSDITLATVLLKMVRTNIGPNLVYIPS